jgi:hypothetical protein
LPAERSVSTCRRCCFPAPTGSEVGRRLQLSLFGLSVTIDLSRKCVRRRKLIAGAKARAVTPSDRFDWLRRFVRFHNSQLQKSPSRIFGQNSGNSVDISKAVFKMVIWKFESSRVSQPVRHSEKTCLIFAERPANGGLLRIGHQSPGSDFGHSQREIADSLRRTFEKLPFLGDRGRRLGSICTAWPSLQCNSPNSPPWPWVVGQFDCGGLPVWQMPESGRVFPG